MHQSQVLLRHLHDDVSIIVSRYNDTDTQTIGGCRQMDYASIEHALQDAFELSKAMAYKTKVNQLAYGGAKSVIYNPNKVPFKDIAPALGELLNELNGAYYLSIDIGTGSAVLDQLASLTPFIYGTSTQQDPSISTASGVIAVIHYLIAQHLKKDPSATHVVIQGLGKVGMIVAKHCLNAGLLVTATDLDQVCVKALETYTNFNITDPAEVLTTPCDILVPAACGHAINHDNFSQIQTQFICPVANNPVADPAYLSERLKERGICYLPDFITNSGGVIFVAQILSSPTQIQFDSSHITQTLEYHLAHTAASMSLYNSTMQHLKTYL